MITPPTMRTVCYHTRYHFGILQNAPVHLELEQRPVGASCERRATTQERERVSWEQTAPRGSVSVMGMLRQQLTGPCRHCPPVGLPSKPANKRLVAGRVDCRPPKGRNFSTK